MELYMIIAKKSAAGVHKTKNNIYFQECGGNMECSNGGCCPRPFCPTGAQVRFLYKKCLELKSYAQYTFKKNV